MRRQWTVVVVGVMVIALVACGPDDSVSPTDAGMDVATDGPAMVPSEDAAHTDAGGEDATLNDAGSGDAGMPDTSVVDADAATDAFDAALVDAGPCNFAAYVVDLIKNHSNDPTPDPALGATCIDNLDPTEFATLF